MAGTLYLVGTPIGNLNDLSPRAIETLKNVDFIAAEDTRVTLKLLNHFGIRRPLISYYEHKKVESAAVIIPRLLGGESCALVSDAGMPAISDPGEALVRLGARYGRSPDAAVHAGRPSLHIEQIPEGASGNAAARAPDDRSLRGAAQARGNARRSLRRAR